MDDQVKLGFEFAREIATQLITLSTGFLALTITFTKELVPDRGPAARKWLLMAWGLHLAAIVFGVWTLSALTGSLMPVGTASAPVFGAPVRLAATLQFVTFALGLAALVVYGITTLVPGMGEGLARRFAVMKNRLRATAWQPQEAKSPESESRE